MIFEILNYCLGNVNGPFYIAYDNILDNSTPFIFIIYCAVCFLIIFCGSYNFDLSIIFMEHLIFYKSFTWIITTLLNFNKNMQIDDLHNSTRLSFFIQAITNPFLFSIIISILKYKLYSMNRISKKCFIGLVMTSLCTLVFEECLKRTSTMKHIIKFIISKGGLWLVGRMDKKSGLYVCSISLSFSATFFLFENILKLVDTKRYLNFRFTYDIFDSETPYVVATYELFSVFWVLGTMSQIYILRKKLSLNNFNS